MSMRRQLYEWQINRQTNGYPLANPTDGTTFEQIAGIPVSIFTGGIGNNITMPAATTATQFVAIDNLRCSPSFFLSKDAVLGAYNYLANQFGVLVGGFDCLPGAVSNILTLTFTAATATTFTLPAPTTNSGSGSSGSFVFQVAPGGAGSVANIFQSQSSGTGYKVGDVLTWDAAALNSIVGVAAASGTLTLTISEGQIAYGNGGGTANTAFTGAAVAGSTGALPKYLPNESIQNPELTFQTTHINPFTSIAGPMMFMQLLINTTSYFNETDGTVGPGLPGTASPCPETAACRSTFEFESPVYILPGQQWDVQVTVYNDSRAWIGDAAKTYNYTQAGYNSQPEDLCCLVQYTLYDGPDALIATKLVEMGIAVRPENVDWYKRQLLEGTI
jgi:hypothetical protein